MGRMAFVLQLTSVYPNYVPIQFSYSLTIKVIFLAYRDYGKFTHSLIPIFRQDNSKFKILQTTWAN